MTDKLVSYEGRTYKYVAKETKWYIRVPSKQYNAEGPGWSWQSLNTERVPKEVKLAKNN